MQFTVNLTKYKLSLIWTNSEYITVIFSFSGFLKNHSLLAFLWNCSGCMAFLECWMPLRFPICGTVQDVWHSLSAGCLFGPLFVELFRMRGTPWVLDASMVPFLWHCAKCRLSFWFLWNCPGGVGTAPSAGCLMVPFLWNCPGGVGTAPSVGCLMVPFLWNCPGGRSILSAHF